jgi:hypothetical protein
VCKLRPLGSNIQAECSVGVNRLSHCSLGAGEIKQLDPLNWGDGTRNVESDSKPAFPFCAAERLVMPTPLL